MAKTAKGMVTEAKSRIENLDPTQVAKEQERGAVIVDLRDDHEILENGKIPGSVHIPRGMLEFRADRTNPHHNDSLNPGQRVILLCANGSRSALGAATLQEMGYTNVAHLEGGFTRWVEESKPLEQG